MDRTFFLAMLVALGAGSLIAEPVANPDFVTMHRGQKARIEVLKNDTGLVDPVSVTITGLPTSGTATVDAAGRIFYAHGSGTPTSDTLRYMLASNGESTEGTVTIQFSENLRIPPHGFALPPTAPSTQYQFVPAFGGLPFTLATAVASVPGDTRRLFVCELQGRIRLIDDVAAANPACTTFLDLPALMATRTGEVVDIGPYAENGLLGLAFHPDHAQNGYFYIFYSVRKNGSDYQRLSRFEVYPHNRDLADPASELVLLEQLDEVPNHNGGDLQFGPDGYLYFSAGDEGDQFDPMLNSQRIDRDFFSGIFRIDVDKRPESSPPNAHPAIMLDDGVARYAVPGDNPFLGAESYGGLPVDPSKVRSEFWATGLRSPWRFSFDRANGDLWCGDVGQYHYEEINLITRGGNYGWIHRDGTHPGYRTPPPGFTATYIDPVYEYNHVELAGDPNYKGNSIIGGVVYRGTRFAGLDGAYICGDWLSGNIWALRRAPTGTVTIERLTSHSRVCAFGIDPSNGDVLLVENGYNTAPIYRLTSAPIQGNQFPAMLSATGLFADVADLTPNPGLLPYEPNLGFWSDHASKRRWFALPDATSQITWSREGSWVFPTGTVWVKHFDLELERGNPASKSRIETRVLVKTPESIYGVSYRWNSEGTDAVLVPEEGASFAIGVVEGGVPRNQVWQIPSRGDCRTCHNAAAGHVLSMDTRQMNRAASILGFAGNQIDTLHAHGFFSNVPSPSHVLPRHVRADEAAFSVESRARSYLSVNCSFCHQPGAGAPLTWDGRAERSLADTRMVHGLANNNFGDPANKLVVPGSEPHSIILNRTAGAPGFTRMPPIATSEIDMAGVALLRDWIVSSLPARQTYEAWRIQHFSSASLPEGAPQADPDSDGKSNQAEFLAGTNPKDRADDAVRPTIGMAGDGITLSFEIPFDRAFQVETSTDLLNWSLWDVAGNHGIPRMDQELTLSGPVWNEQQYFRVRISEP